MNALQLWPRLDAVGYGAMRLLLGALWQSSILLLAIAALTWLLRGRRAAVRHALWVAGLVAAPLLPLMASAAMRSGAPQAPVQILPAYAQPVALEADVAQPIAPVFALEPGPSPVEHEAVVQPPQDAGRRLYPWAMLLIAYAAGLAGFLVWIGMGRSRIRRWIRSGAPVLEGRALSTFREARETAGLGRGFLVLESDRVPAPISYGLIHPVVVLPKGLAGQLSDVELRALAIHELTHLKRNDGLVLHLAALVRAVLFFHPLVWLAARQVSSLAEAACDDAVLDAGGEPVPYARMLARLAEELPRGSVTTELAAGIVLSKRAFLRRVQAILSDRRDRIRKLSRLALAATLFGALLSLGVALALPLGERPTADRTEILTAEPAEDAEIAQPEPVRQWKATLPNGVTVELVGVSYHPSEGRPWWRPDGSPLVEAPYERIEGLESLETAFGEKIRDYPHRHEFALRLEGIAEGGGFGTTSTFIPRALSTAMGAGTKAGVRPVPEVFVQGAAFPEPEESASFRYAVSAGEWTTVATTTRNGGTTHEYDFGEIKFSKVVFTGGGDTSAPLTGIAMAGIPADLPARVVAVDVEGGIHLPAFLGPGPFGGGAAVAFPQMDGPHQSFFFSHPALSQIKGFRLQIRPFKWVEFRNVSLKPGQNTSVKVVVEGAGEAASEGEETEPNPEALMREHHEEIKAAAEAYARDHAGQWPETDDDLLSYIRDKELAEKLRPAFEWGRVEFKRNALKQRLHGLSHAILVCRHEHGAWPARLKEVEQLGYLGPENPLESFNVGEQKVQYVIPKSDDPNEALLYHWPPYLGGTSVLYQNQELDWVEPDRDGSLTNPRTGAVIRPAELPPAEDLTFGPVIERVVNELNSGSDCFLDMETGRILSLPERLEQDSRGERDWCRANGIDMTAGWLAVGIPESSTPEVFALTVVGIDTFMACTEPEAWDDTPSAVVTRVSQSLMRNQPMGPGVGKVLPPHQGDDPATAVFRTREGGTGVLQIVGLTEDPPGVNIRYKMVATEKGEPTAVKPEPAELPVRLGWPSVRLGAQDDRVAADGAIIQVQTDVVALVLKRSDLPGLPRDYNAFNNRQVVEKALWHKTMRAVMANGQRRELPGLGGTVVRPIVSRNRRHVFVEVTLPSPGGAENTYGIRDRFAFPVVEDGPQAPAIAEAWIGAQEAREMDLEDCAVVLVLKPTVIAPAGPMPEAGARLAGAVGPLGAQQPEWDRKVYESLGERVSLAFIESPLADVVEFLKATTGVNFALFHEDLPPDGAPVSIYVETTLRHALDLICDLTEMDWKVQGGLIKIGAPETVAEYEMRVYDVRDLLLSVADQVPGRGRIGGRRGGEGTSAARGSLLQRAENLVLLIKQSCGAGTWMEVTPADVIPVGHAPAEGPPAELPPAPARAGPQGRAFIRPGDPGMLVIIQSAEVHRCIEGLLRQIRGAQRVQVQLDIIPWVFGRGTPPPEPEEPAPEGDVEGVLWRGGSTRLVGASGQALAVAGVLGSTVLRPFVSHDRRHVFVEVAMSSGVGDTLAHTMQGIPDGEPRWFVATGPAARMIAAEWMGGEKARQADLEGCSVALLVKARILLLAEEEERLR